MTSSVKKQKSGYIQSIHDSIMNINNSKIFAGLMIITLNIASKFSSIKLGKTAEMYLKYTFSRQILVFAIAWMGTRDIYIATFLTMIFIILFDFLFNENSSLCILPNDFHEYYKNIDEDPDNISKEDYIKAKTIVDNYVDQQEKDTAKK